MKCMQCGETSFRTSRLRKSDVPQLFHFHYPVRCRTCKLRYFVNLIEAWNVHRADLVRREEQRHKKPGAGGETIA
ncbi:MAG: hypothetical protein ACRD3N_06725 [Terracidiphilus sp.]